MSSSIKYLQSHIENETIKKECFHETIQMIVVEKPKPLSETWSQDDLAR